MRSATHAGHECRGRNLRDGRITFLTPGDRALGAVPTTEAEGPGVGRALGGVVGGAAGAATGLQAGALLSIFVPGVGPVLALGALLLRASAGGSGVRDAEAAANTAAGGEFTRDEADFRRGFEAALILGRPGEGWDDVVDELRTRTQRRNGEWRDG